MAPTLNGPQAAAVMSARKLNVPGYCLQTVAQSFGNPPSIGPGPHPVPTAWAAWLASPGQHAPTYDVPVGAPVCFGPSPTRTDANKNAGDITISLGGNRLIATDVGGAGRIGVTTIEARAAQTARPYVGWLDVFLGYPVAVGTAPAGNGSTPITPVKDHDMSMFYRASQPGEAPTAHVQYQNIFIQEDRGPLRLLAGPEWGARSVVQGAQYAEWTCAMIEALIAKVGVYQVHADGSVNYDSIVY